jgi:ubiquinone/menaquinone biosynthesis C-methylase UbiE
LEPDQLYNDPELAQFYDIENEWRADQEFCKRLAKNRDSVLDLGCGTGWFAAAVAEAHGGRVVGLDPARAMLDIAAKRPGGDRVSWVEGDARTARLGERFDLVVLTGHAFQVFLSEADQAAVLRTIASHLTPEGRFVFDSRNPAAEEWKEWTPEASQRVFEHPSLGRVIAWNDVSRDADTGVVTYETHYDVVATGRRYTARSMIAFPAQERLAALIEAAGLHTDRWLGDWSGARFTQASPEIIPLGRLK